MSAYIPSLSRRHIAHHPTVGTTLTANPFFEDAKPAKKVRRRRPDTRDDKEKPGRPVTTRRAQEA